jgi:hypothetical protein
MPLEYLTIVPSHICPFLNGLSVQSGNDIQGLDPYVVVDDDGDYVGNYHLGYEPSYDMAPYPASAFSPISIGGVTTEWPPPEFPDDAWLATIRQVQFSSLK